MSRDVGRSDRAYWLHDDGSGIATSRGAGITARFTPTGLFVSAGGGELSLSLTGLGRGAAVKAVRIGPPTTWRNRAVYRAVGLREWFENGPLGIEQGFSISRRPSITSVQPLTIALRSGGNLHPAARGANAWFASRSGRSVLTYRGLRAVDASGRALAAWLTARGRQLLLHVNDGRARYPIRIDPYIQHGSKLTPNNETGPANFGHSVAISDDGSTAIIGAPDDHNPQGAAWIFVRSGNSWTQQATLTDVGSTTFGWSVALSADGNTALIGGYSDNRTGGSQVQIGSAWVFTRSGTKWAQQGLKLGPNDNVSADSHFGYSVALSDDGSTALIGGPADNSGQGAAWVFTRSTSTWSQQGARIVPTDFASSTFFGESVALSGDGNTALVGASNGNGGAFVFDRSGSTWSENGSGLQPRQTLEFNSGYGYSVALSGDGTVAIVAAPGNHAAWVFLRSGSSWLQGGTNLATSLSGGTVGGAVALSEDGSTALAAGGANGSSAVWFFHRSASGFAPAGDATPSDASGQSFGSSVSLAADAQTALIGGADDSSGAGAAWVFKYIAPPPPPPPHFTLTVIKTGRGAGTVTSSPAGINCGSVCSAPFAPGTKVTLTPTPATNSEFGSWSGLCPGYGAKQSEQPTEGGAGSACTGVTMDANHTVLVSFVSKVELRRIAGGLKAALSRTEKNFGTPSSVGRVECAGKESSQAKVAEKGTFAAAPITAANSLSKGAADGATNTGRVIVFASARHVFLHAGTATITQRLTRAGLRLLRQAGRLHRTVKLHVLFSFTFADPTEIPGGGFVRIQPPASTPCG